MGRPVRRRLPPRLRRLDPGARQPRLRGRAAGRAAEPWAGLGAVRALHGRVGRALACRGDVEGAESVSVPPAPPLLLASTSPQRRAILEQLGLPFDVVAPRYEEYDPPDADPVALVREHAQGKARSV